MAQKDDEIVSAAAQAVVENGGTVGLRNHPRLGAVTKEDREALSRVTGMSLDEFNRKFATKLQGLADRVADKMGDFLQEDRFKPGELAFLLSVLEDKRGRLDGRTQLTAGQVNVQINNYGSARSKEEILNSLAGVKEIVATPIDSTDVI